MEDPPCNSSFGSMVSLDYVTPDTASNGDVLGLRFTGGLVYTDHSFHITTNIGVTEQFSLEITTRARRSDQRSERQPHCSGQEVSPVVEKKSTIPQNTNAFAIWTENQELSMYLFFALAPRKSVGELIVRVRTGATVPSSQTLPSASTRWYEENLSDTLKGRHHLTN